MRWRYIQGASSRWRKRQPEKLGCRQWIVWPTALWEDWWRLNEGSIDEERRRRVWAVPGIAARYREELGNQGSNCKWKRTGTPSAEGARIEAPKAPRGVGCGERVSASPSGLGRGLCPLPRIFFFDFRPRNSVFDAFWALYFTIQLPALRTESGYIHVGDRYI